MSDPTLVTALLPSALAFVRLAPVAVWWARASSGFFPKSVAWSAIFALACFFGAGATPESAQLLHDALLGALFRELAIGVVTCVVLAAPFAALRFALSALGAAVGGALGPLVPRVFGLGVCALLMQLALHRALVRALAESFGSVPIGAPSLAFPELSWALFAVFGHASSLCLTLLLPWLCALLMLDLGVAIGARFFGETAAGVAHLPIRVSVLALALGTAWLSFAERMPLLLRGSFSLLTGVLRRVAP